MIVTVDSVAVDTVIAILFIAVIVIISVVVIVDAVFIVVHCIDSVCLCVSLTVRTHTCIHMTMCMYMSVSVSCSIGSCIGACITVQAVDAVMAVECVVDAQWHGLVVTEQCHQELHDLIGG